MILSQHKEGRQCDTTEERRFQITEPISESLQQWLVTIVTSQLGSDPSREAAVREKIP
jgi:hypothetical protein